MDHVGELLIRQGFRRDLIAKVTAATRKGFRIKQIIPVSVCTVIKIIASFFVLIHQFLQYSIQAVIGQCHVQPVHFLCCGHFHFLISIVIRKIGFPGLVSVGGCGGMVAVIHVKLYAVPCKGSRIFHHIFHTVHDHFCSHWHKGIACIHGNGMVSLGIDAACRRAAGPLSAADGATAVATGYNLPQGFPHPHHLCLCHGFPCAFRGNAVLTLKDFLDLILYLLIGKFPVLCGKIRDQVVRIVGDLVNLVAVLVITGMAALHTVDLLIQSCFQFGIRIFHCINILICTPVSRAGNRRRRPTLDRCAAARQKGSNHDKE